jgi:hypothetical protein
VASPQQRPARRPEPFRPPHDPVACAVCRYLALHPEHDPATCPGCLHVAPPDYDADPKQDAVRGRGVVGAIGVVCVVVVFVMALYLFFSNDLAVLAR